MYRLMTNLDKEEAVAITQCMVEFNVDGYIQRKATNIYNTELPELVAFYVNKNCGDMSAFWKRFDELTVDLDTPFKKSIKRRKLIALVDKLKQQLSEAEIELSKIK